MSAQAQAPAEVDVSKYVETRFYGERPHVRGRRIPVATIAYYARSQNWKVADLAYEFGLSEPQVLAALLYYAEHQDKIDKQEADYQAELDEAYRQYSDKIRSNVYSSS
jgi:uncharacterized protein (DUF433 family)